MLVIDDERDIREGTRDFLLEYDCDVLIADSGDQALSLLEEACVIPDVIVADYRLRDEENGVLAVEQIRQAIDPEIPAIIITGDTSPERIREAKASGHSLLHKPVSGEELLTAINRPHESTDMNVLIVEDHRLVADALQLMLEDMPEIEQGDLLLFEYTGTETARRATQMPIGLILADVFMPGIDGFGLLEAVKQSAAQYTGGAVERIGG